AAPGSSGNASAPGAVGSPSQDISKPMSAGMSNVMTAPSPQGKSMTGQEKSDYVYKTDAETDELQSAIAEFNRRFCPPQTPITEINRESIGILQKYEVLKEAPQSLNDLVIRDGKVYRREKRDAAQQQQLGENPGSLFGSFGATAKSLDDQAPKSQGNKIVDNPNLVEKRVTVRQKSGDYEEIKYTVPQVPGRVKSPPKKVPVRTRSDIVRRQILAPRYKATVPIQPTDRPVTASSTAKTQ
ncbi:MAG TPA: hypothetical protein PKO06_25130, partial [Candidatus Ozemobacteraceae bacterium]|nr:hypothetical protein [Candidatus Ozemobacteraceae bacterium]